MRQDGRIAGRVALVAVTRGGARLAARLAEVVPDASVYVAARWCGEAGRGAVPVGGGELGELVAREFRSCDGLVFFTAVGVAVRLIAPCLRSKYEDPAVVAVDDAGRYAVCVLSGHLGGGNALAVLVAAALGAQAVVTTASEARGTLAVDLLGREYGWRIADPRPVKRVSAALVNGEPVGVYQDAGETEWRKGADAGDGPGPAVGQGAADEAEWREARGQEWREGRAQVVEYASMEALAAAGCPGLVVTDRLLAPELAQAAEAWVVYRPRSLVLGIGASSGVEADEVEMLCREAVSQGGLAWESVAEVATLDRKTTERGLVEFAERHGLAVRGFGADELAGVEVPHPSAVVAGHVGTASVCEAAALLATGGELVVPKQKSARATVAVARRVVRSRDA